MTAEARTGTRYMENKLTLKEEINETSEKIAIVEDKKL